MMYCIGKSKVKVSLLKDWNLHKWKKKDESSSESLVLTTKHSHVSLPFNAFCQGKQKWLIQRSVNDECYACRKGGFWVEGSHVRFSLQLHLAGWKEHNEIFFDLHMYFLTWGYIACMNSRLTAIIWELIKHSSLWNTLQCTLRKISLGSSMAQFTFGYWRISQSKSMIEVHVNNCREIAPFEQFYVFCIWLHFLSEKNWSGVCKQVWQEQSGASSFVIIIIGSASLLGCKVWCVFKWRWITHAT